MTAKPQRKMVNLDIVETSGVDHPAHLREGWLVKKSATAEDIDALFGTVTKTKEVEPVAEATPAAPTQEDFDALVAKNAEQAAEIESLTKAAEAPVAPVVVETPAEALLKSVPQEVRDMIEKAEARTAAAEEAIAKERDVRLDAEAVSVSKAAFSHIGLDHSAVAPALRRIALINEDLAKSVTDVLKAAEGQLATAGLFTEIGKSAVDSEDSTLDKVAKSLIAADPTLTYASAISKALDTNPSLYLEGK